MILTLLYRYRGIAACFNILARCLGGKYVNFGVFWLYQDEAIEAAFNMMFQFMLNIPLDDMMVRKPPSSSSPLFPLACLH
jgi:hypothetical protein